MGVGSQTDSQAEIQAKENEQVGAKSCVNS